MPQFTIKGFHTPSGKTKSAVVTAKSEESAVRLAVHSGFRTKGMAVVDDDLRGLAIDAMATMANDVPEPTKPAKTPDIPTQPTPAAPAKVEPSELMQWFGEDITLTGLVNTTIEVILAVAGFVFIADAMKLTSVTETVFQELVVAVYFLIGFCCIAAATIIFNLHIIARSIKRLLVR